MERTREVRLKDLDEAAYLWCSGFIFLRAEQEQSAYRATTFFILSAPDDLDIEAARNKYRNGSASVEPKLFASKQYEFRKIMREMRGRDPRQNMGGPPI
jgi:hypothetical protein